jgi:hypothetical protein
MTEQNDNPSNTSILREIEAARSNLPKLEIQSVTCHFLTAIYEKTPYRRIKTTLTFPEDYPGHPLIVDVAAEKGVPPGLKKKLENVLGDVAQENKGLFSQVEPVLSRLINFVDTNKFVPCWKELRQAVEKVQKSAETPIGKGSTIAINDVQGLIKLRLQGFRYYYSCSITIDDGYPSTTSHEDWGKACKLLVKSTNFPPKVETILTTQARELVRRMQDGMTAEDALHMSNPITAPVDLMKKGDAPKVRLTQDVLKGLHKDVETLAHVRDLRQVNAATDRHNAKVNANTARERKEARREIGKITKDEIAKDASAEEKEKQWQLRERARLAGYNFSEFDGSSPQPSLLTLVNFLMRKIQNLPEEICPVCKGLSLPNDPSILKALYDSTCASASEEEKMARRLARKKRPIRTYCGCWYHYSCLDKFMTEPPFGAACPFDGRRVYHPDWPSDMKELERAWAAKEARKREIEDATMAFL